MNVRAQTVAAGRARAEPGTGLLYGWLLLALFIEYARPTNQLTFLAIPFFYTLVPMTLLLVTMFAQGLRPMKEIFADPIAKWVTIIIGLTAISCVVTGFHALTTTAFVMVLGYLFLFLLIARIATTESRLYGIIITLVLAHFYLLAVNFNVLTNPSERQYLIGGTFLSDGNDYSLSLCILIPGMIAVALSARNVFWKVFSWTAVAVIVMAIVSSQSRGGTLGIAAIFGYLWLRSSRKLVTGVGIAMIGVLVLLYAPPAYFERMGTVSSMTIDGSSQGRIDAWKASLGMALHNPVFGIGAGHFAPTWGKTAHSTYFLALGELGLPGLVCVLMIIFGNMRENARVRKRSLEARNVRPSEDFARKVKLLDMLNAAMVGFAVAGAFLSATFYPHMYVLTGLLISARALVSRAAAAHPASASGTDVRAGRESGPGTRLGLPTYPRGR